MAGSALVLYRNYSESDTTYDNSRMVGVILPTIEDIGWEPPSGKRFKEWNTERDGSGNYSFQPGEEQWLCEVLCAIWEEIPVITYLTTNTELASVADAIRSKGGTSSPLVYPTGFVSAINAIATGGGGGIKYAQYFTNDGETFEFYEGDMLSVVELQYDCVFIGFCTDLNSGDIISIAGSQHSDYPDTLIFSNINQQDSTPISISSFGDGEIMVEYYGSVLQGYLYAFVEGTGVDLSNDTVESSVLLEGYTAHDKSGAVITGSLAIATMSEVETYFGLT